MNRRAVWLLALSILAAGTAQAAAPEPGRYAATMCVTLSGSAPNCGPVEFELNGHVQATVRIADIAYVLWLYPSQLSVVLMQGSMQIHEFNSDYAWQEQTLQFADTEKHARYEVKLGARKTAP